MLKKPKPKQLSQEALQSVISASISQTAERKQAKTYDPNYPVFNFPVNDKVLVYIPNREIVLDDGSKMLYADKCAVHQVSQKGSFSKIRCTNGVVSEELGLDGSCPLCDAMAKCWELYNTEYAQIAAAKGIDQNTEEGKAALKEDRKKILNKMAVKNPDIVITFPIVVIDCVTDNKGRNTLVPAKDEEGKLVGKAFWYSIKETTYNEVWVKAMDSLEPDIDGNPAQTLAGHFCILNYTFGSDKQLSEKEARRESARSLKVTVKNMGESFKAWGQYFDQMTESWTPAKAMEVCVDVALRDMTEVQEATVEIMKETEDKLALAQLAAGHVAQPSFGSTATSAEAALSEFAGVQEAPVSTPPAATSGFTAPAVGIQ